MFEIKITGKVSKVNETESITWVTMTRAFTHKDERRFQDVTIAFKDAFGKRLQPGVVIEVPVNLSVHEGNLTAWPAGKTKVFNPEDLKA